ncbi:uncharacterized protein LOC119388990 [Rhipicephalus sanguineus]|uniref:uncharacterized protein LOC119388990 n=1 Tax=Rhipicephalus sanguineus TaxID=34632 RepID=UPI001893BEFB|nr:uncharacterized protein LOC119388990 [Rhipicephalus sanguineus]
MADQATDTACVDVQQRDSGAVSPKHVLAKDAGSAFFQEGHLNAGEQQHAGELAKMMAKMMSCSPMDMGPDGGHLPPNDMAASHKMRDLLAKAEQSGEEDGNAVQRFEDLVAQGRHMLEQINDTLNTLLAAEMNSAAAEDASR